MPAGVRVPAPDAVTVRAPSGERATEDAGRRLQGYSGRGSFESWVTAAAARLLLDRQRAAKPEIPHDDFIGALPFTAFSMVVGSLVLLVICLFNGKTSELGSINPAGWAAIAYLGVFGSAALWVLWSIGLRYARPSLVALTNSVNTLTASLLGALLLGEPLGLEFAVGFCAVVAGIAIALKLVPTRP